MQKISFFAAALFDRSFRYYYWLVCSSFIWCKSRASCFKGDAQLDNTLPHEDRVVDKMFKDHGKILTRP